jgi:hypothetical protein
MIGLEGLIRKHEAVAQVLRSIAALADEYPGVESELVEALRDGAAPRAAPAAPAVEPHRPAEPSPAAEPVKVGPMTSVPAGSRVASGEQVMTRLPIIPPAPPAEPAVRQLGTLPITLTRERRREMVLEHLEDNLQIGGRAKVMDLFAHQRDRQMSSEIAESHDDFTFETYGKGRPSVIRRVR